jgi:hypothetical protein
MVRHPPWWMAKDYTTDPVDDVPAQASRSCRYGKRRCQDRAWGASSLQ